MIPVLRVEAFAPQRCVLDKPKAGERPGFSQAAIAAAYRAVWQLVANYD